MTTEPRIGVGIATADARDGFPIPAPVTNPGVPAVGNPPTYTPNTSSAAASVASTQSMIDAEVRRAADALSAENAARTAATANPPVRNIADYLNMTGGQTPQQYQAQQYSNIGVNPNDYFTELAADVKAVEALQNDLNTSITARDRQISGITGMTGISQDFLNNSIAQINRNANITISQKTADLNTKVALIEMKKGNFAEAQNFVKQAVDAYTSGLSDDLKLYEQFQQNNKDLLDSLDKKYQDALTAAYKLKQQELDDTKKEKDAVGNLMLQYPNAGITLNDTKSQAEIKASRVAGQSIHVTGSADTGYAATVIDSNGRVVSSHPFSGAGSSGSSGSQSTVYDSTLQGFLGQGMSPDQAVLAVIAATGENFTERDKTNILRRAEALQRNVVIPQPTGGFDVARGIPPMTTNAREIANRFVSGIVNHPLVTAANQWVSSIRDFLFRPHPR